MRWPVPAAIGLSSVITASAAIARPSLFSAWNSEIFSSSGQPASVTPNGLFLNAGGAAAPGAAFSRRPFAQESLPCAWHQMQ